VAPVNLHCVQPRNRNYVPLLLLAIGTFMSLTAYNLLKLPSSPKTLPHILPCDIPRTYYCTFLETILVYGIIHLFIYCFFTIYSRYLKRVISKRDRCEYLKQVPSIDGSLEILWDPLATFCWVFSLFQVDWTGLLLVGCCFVQSDFDDSSCMFLWLLLHMVCLSRCVR
jgi:hypothetical protein